MKKKHPQTKPTDLISVFYSCQVRRFTNREGILTAPSVTWKPLRRAVSGAGDPFSVGKISREQFIHHTDGKPSGKLPKHTRKVSKKHLFDSILQYRS